MTIILFSKTVAFPIAPLRAMLSQYCDAYIWRCGENDTGKAEEMGTYASSDMIMGRSGDDMIMVSLKPRYEALEQTTPPHEWYLEIGNPTTDDAQLADKITGIVCTALMVPDLERSFCQLAPNGKWLGAGELMNAMDDVLGGRPLASVSGGTAMPGTAGRYEGLSNDQAMNLSQMDEAMARILHEKGMGSIADDMGLTQAPPFARELPQPNKLPTLVMLATHPLFIDWAMTGEALRAVDPGGDWTVTPEGPTSGRFTGRGAVVTVTCTDAPLPGYLVAQGLAREHYLTPAMRTEVMSHKAYTAIRIDLDTQTADFVDVRQTAKAVAMFMAKPATDPGFVGIFNAGLGVARPSERVRDAIAALHSDEVPIGLWIWAAPDNPQTDAVSISTSGMRPFVGYEVECWNAPGTIAEVGDRLNGVLRYLLINGPVIEHGDTIGVDTGDKSTRCFHGLSNAQRAEEGIPALLLEFDNKGGVKPKADAPIADVPGAEDMRAMLAELRKGADATSNEALDAIAAAIANPPSRDVIESDDNPVFKGLMKLIENEQSTGRIPKPAPAPSPLPQPLLNGRPLFGRKPATGFGRKGL